MESKNKTGQFGWLKSVFCVLKVMMIVNKSFPCDRQTKKFGWHETNRTINQLDGFDSWNTIFWFDECKNKCLSLRHIKCEIECAKTRNKILFENSVQWLYALCVFVLFSFSLFFVFTYANNRATTQPFSFILCWHDITSTKHES